MRFLLALLAWPLVAEPLFNLFDCKGVESLCAAQFPGKPPMPDEESPYFEGGRVVVDGIDLGPAWGSSEGVDLIYGPINQFLALYVRGTQVIGHLTYNPQDFDGRVVSWLLDGTSAALTVTEITTSFPGERIADVSSNGHYVGAHNGQPFYDGLLLYPGEGQFKNWERWEDHLRTFTETSMMLRVNDAGQALALFGYFDPDSLPEDRMFLLSPVGVPVPPNLHTPEPGTLLLVGAGVLLLLRSR